MYVWIVEYPFYILIIYDWLILIDIINWKMNNAKPIIGPLSCY